MGFHIAHRWRPGLAVLTVLVVLLIGCQADQLSAPGGNAPPTIELRGQAFLFDIDLQTGVIQVSHPRPAPSGGGQGAGGQSIPSFSILNDDALGIVASNVVFLPPGAPAPVGKRRVRFDLALNNKLSVTDLVTPTFPRPPAGVSGILFFPFTAKVIAPQSGSATASSDWDGNHTPGSGAPFNFFNDFSTCPTTAASDCYRWESYPAPLGPGQTTALTTVGFDVAANATLVQAYIVVAADLLDHPAPPPLPQSGAIAGHVTSPEAGALKDVSVGVTGGTPVLSDITGGYQLVSLPTGPMSVTLSNLPAGCTDPGTRAVTVTAGGISTVDFSVTCPAPSGTTGTVVGTVTSPSLGNLYGVTVVANPGGKGAATDGAGGFTIPGLPAGPVVVTISNLPNGCTNPGTQGVTVVAGGATGTNFAVSCSGVGGTTGALTGTVNGNAFGIPGVTVTLQPGNLTTTTDAHGVFGFTNLPVGTVLVTLAPLVQGCQAVGTQAVGIVAGQSSAVNLNSVCAPVLIAIAAGNGQTAPDATQVPILPAVVVTDGNNNPVSGVSVTFAVTGGGGSIINGATFNTNPSGIATVGGWLLGQLTGSNSLVPNTLAATAAPSGIAGNGLTFTANAVGNTWQTFASMPTPRQGAAGGVINGRLYVAGGYGDDGSGNGNQVLATLEAYDPVNDSWKPMASMPTARLGAAATVLNGMLYVVGGDVGGLSQALEAYDPVTDRWTTLAPMPTARFDFAVEAVNGILYAISGNTNGSATGVVEAYDPKTDHWTTRASIPSPRAEFASGVIKGVVYIVGGNGGPNAGIVQVYDPATDTWTTKAPITPRFSHTGAVLGNLLYAMGGFYNSGLVADVEAYDPTADSWSTRAQLPTSRATMVTGVINGVIYAVGGSTPNGASVATVEGYQP